MQRPPLPNPEHATSWWRFVLAVSIVVVLWIVVLPRIGALPPVRDYIDCNESLGIDPSVKFYSELPAMRSIQFRVEEIRRSEPESFQ